MSTDAEGLALVREQVAATTTLAAELRELRTDLHDHDAGAVTHRALMATRLEAIDRSIATIATAEATKATAILDEATGRQRREDAAAEQAARLVREEAAREAATTTQVGALAKALTGLVKRATSSAFGGAATGGGGVVVIIEFVKWLLAGGLHNVH